MAATVTSCRVALGFVATTTTATNVFRPASELMLVCVCVCVGALSITAHFAVAVVVVIVAGQTQ